MDLKYAHVGGCFDCGGAFLDVSQGVALDCNGFITAGPVFMTKGFCAKGAVEFTAAEIGGNFDCQGGQFEEGQGVALNCTAATIFGQVICSTGFRAKGMVNFSGAKMCSQFVSEGGKFEANEGVALDCEGISVRDSVVFRSGCAFIGCVEFQAATLGASFICNQVNFGGKLDLQGAKIAAQLELRNLQHAPSAIDLTDAATATLTGDVAAWENAKPLRLAGFRYTRLESDMTLAQRLKWLEGKLNKPQEGKAGKSGANRKSALVEQAANSTKPDFDPDPYTQLAKVYRSRGLVSDAAKVLETREHQLRRSRALRARQENKGFLRACAHIPLALGVGLVNFMFHRMFGYGHRPGYALLWVFALWLFSVILYGNAYDAGQMAPNSDVILTSTDWLNAVNAEGACAKARVADCTLPLKTWLDSDSAKDYETFSWGLYALDLFVPLDALGQEKAWAPSKIRGAWGWWGYYARFVIQMAGWIITAVGAATLTGLIGRRD